MIDEVGRGETVGELGLITGDRRAATVYATRDAILARLSRASFDTLCARHPHAMMERFAGGQLRRVLRAARGEGSRRQDFRGAVALVAADATVPLRWFADELVGRLGSIGPTLALTAATATRCSGGQEGAPSG